MPAPTDALMVVPAMSVLPVGAVLQLFGWFRVFVCLQAMFSKRIPKQSTHTHTHLVVALRVERAE